MPYQERKKYFAATRILYLAAGILMGFIICRMFLVTFKMPDSSMEPNLQKGDTVLFLKHATPSPGDIVLLDSPAEPGAVLARRIVSIEGDTVEIKSKLLYINGKQRTANWRQKSTDKRVFPMNFTNRDNMPVMKLGRKEYFVLSDNLDPGYDSRNLGLVRRKSIIGKMIYRY